MKSTFPFVFVASRPYSGSTLLSFLANAHPEIASVGEGCGSEIADPTTYRCSCGEVIGECSFWLAVSRAMRARGFAFDTSSFDTRFDFVSGSRWVGRLRGGSLRSSLLEDMRDRVLHIWPRHTAQMREVAARNQALAASILELTGKSVYFDASKYHITVRYLRKYADLDLRVVHLVRDVRGATASYMSKPHGGTLRASVRKWIQGQLNIERQMAGLPPHRRLRIRYEDICQSPRGALGRLYEFCGVDTDVELENFRDTEHHIIGKPDEAVRCGSFDHRRALETILHSRSTSGD